MWPILPTWPILPYLTLGLYRGIHYSLNVNLEDMIFTIKNRVVISNSERGDTYPLPFNGDEMLDYKEKLAIICLVLHEGMLIQNTIDVSFVWLSTLSG